MEAIWSLVWVYSIKIVVAIAIFVIGRKVAKFAINMLVKVMEKAKVDITLVKFLDNVLNAVALVAIVLAALSQLGIETTSFVAILGAAGLAVGLAFKDSLSNVGSGIMIILFRPFKVGDFVETAGEAGQVEEISIFHTIMKTTDNKVIIIPNSKITSDNIVNFTGEDTRRCDFVFGVSYSDDIKLVKETLKEIIAQDSRVIQEPEPLVAVSNLNNSSVDFTVRAWVKTDDYWNFRFDTIEKVKLTFDEKGISIPFPQMDVYYRQKD
ncbi:MAG: mechanosensitive ion channel family protein [Arcobacteraceae bacterium]